MTRTELLALAKNGIPLNTQMVQQLPPRGIKGRTMRAMKTPGDNPVGVVLPELGYALEGRLVGDASDDTLGFMTGVGIIRPRYNVGDIVYVKETFAEDRCCECEGAPAALRGPCAYNHECLRGYVYRADGEKPDGWAHTPRWKPSIHMPRTAARTFLRITGVRVQRPQELTLEEIAAEGVPHKLCKDECCCDCGGCGLNWRDVWDSVQQKKDLALYGYQANPWCFVYEFEVVPYV